MPTFRKQQTKVRSVGCHCSATSRIPNSALPPVHQESINSIVRKTLLATPEFPRLYADMVLTTRPNSAEAKILRPKYQQVLSCPKRANRAKRHKIPAALASFEPGELRNPQRTAQAARACKGRTRNWEKSEDERYRGRAGLNRQLYVTALL